MIERESDDIGVRRRLEKRQGKGKGKGSQSLAAKKQARYDRRTHDSLRNKGHQ